MRSYEVIVVCGGQGAIQEAEEAGCAHHTYVTDICSKFNGSNEPTANRNVQHSTDLVNLQPIKSTWGTEPAQNK